MHRYSIVILAASVCFAPGCGDDGRLPTYEARGQVVFQDGNPLEGGTIIFESMDHPVSPRSLISPDGKFELGTYETGDGAPVGQYRVAIMPPSQTGGVDRDEARPPAIIDPKYKDFEKSGLEYKVEAKDANEFVVKLDRPAR